MASSAAAHPTEDRDIEAVFDFPFLADDESVEFLNEHGRVFFIVRGLPGTGKSVLGDLLRRHYPASKIYWADKMFLSPLAPQRNPETLRASHKACQEKIERFMRESVPVIINRNTNVTVREVSNYTRLAARYGYLVVLADTGDKFAIDPKELAVTNSKGLNVDYMQVRHKQWQKVYPIYTGWFLCPADGLFLQRRFAAIAEHLRESGWEVPEVVRPEGQPFCLGRPCWYGDAAADRDYCDSKEVKDAFGTVHTLLVVGYAVVRNLVCALVALDEAQTALLGPSGADASGCDLGSLLSRLSIAEREGVPSEIELAEVVDDKDYDAPSLLERVDDIVSGDSISFVILGSCKKGGEASFVYSKSLRSLWQTTCANMSISRDGIGCTDTKIVADAEAFREGQTFLILDRRVELRSMFGGYYQPYEAKGGVEPKSIPCKFYAATRRCKNGTLCRFRH